MDTTPASGGPANETDTSIRMLDALEPNARSAPGTAARRGFGWGLATLLLLVACGASWFWWSQRARADDSAERAAQASAPAPTAAASAVAEPATAATIVATPQPAAPAASAALAASSQTVQPVPAESAATHQADATTPAKPRPKAANPGSETRVAAASNAERKRAAHPTKTTSRSAAAAASNDPDVALLSAMLATMSRDARAAPDAAPSSQAQLTIAQLVQRCEVRGVKDAIETFECKRRICDGYWGKADACPMSLSPKKN